MKYGVMKELGIDQSNLFVTLPKEMFDNVVGFLPAYAFKGTNSVQQVCANWHEYIPLTKKTLQEIMDSIIDAQDVLAILTDDMLFNQLSYNQLLNIVGADFSLTMGLLKHFSLSGEEMACLGTRSELIAQEILDTKSLCDKLDTKSLSHLGEAHLVIAQQILNTQELCNKLNVFDLTKLSKAHLSISIQILDRPELRNKLERYSLLLGQSNKLRGQQLGLSTTPQILYPKKVFVESERADLEMQVLCLADEEIRDNVKKSGWTYYGKTRLERAHRLYSKFDVDALCHLSKESVAILLKLMNKNTLPEELTVAPFLKVFEAQRDVVEYIMQKIAQKKLDIDIRYSSSTILYR